MELNMGLIILMHLSLLLPAFGSDFAGVPPHGKFRSGKPNDLSTPSKGRLEHVGQGQGTENSFAAEAKTTFAEDLASFKNEMRKTLEGLSKRIYTLEGSNNWKGYEEEKGGAEIPVGGGDSLPRQPKRKRRDAKDDRSNELEDNEPKDALQEESIDALRKRMDSLEAIVRKKSVRSCDALYKTGIKLSGAYTIDPDGADFGDPPIEVYCNFDDGEAATVISHKWSNDSVAVANCGPPGCSRHVVEYDAKVEQINALMEISESCQQQITYDCYSAPLSLWDNFHYSWWIGSDDRGRKNYYWSGEETPLGHVCDCGLSRNCTAQPVLKCNCDASIPEWFQDDGVITNKKNLPVHSLHFGGLKYSTQKARFSLGPLKCSGMNMAALNNFDSCRTMKMVGHRSPGYYMLDSTTDRTKPAARIARCNFDLDTRNPLFEEAVVDHLRPNIAFVATYQNSTADYATVCCEKLIFNHVRMNHGQGYNRDDGTFNAPTSGVYFFSFLGYHAMPASHVRGYSEMRARIHKNGDVYAETANNYDDVGSMTVTTVLHLEAGDSLHVSYAAGFDNGVDYQERIQFMGFLVFAHL